MNSTGTSLRLTWRTLRANAALGALKCLAGLWGHSQAVLADGINNILDTATDLGIIFGLKMAAVPRDGNHPYGHHKFVSMANLFLALILLTFCAGLVYTSVRELRQGHSAVPSLCALAAALVSIAVKEILFWMTWRTAKRIKSRVLLTNAWNHRSDAVSSLIVALAVGAAWLGGTAWAFLDDVVGLALGGILSLQAMKFVHEACKDLLDAAPERKVIDDIREHILPTPGVAAYHGFRARRVGDMIEVDLHLQVDPGLQVKEGHAIASRVKKNILTTHPEVIDVLVHIEPATGSHLKEEGVHDFK